MRILSCTKKHTYIKQYNKAMSRDLLKYKYIKSVDNVL